MCKFSFDWIYTSTTQHHIEETPVFAGGGVRAAGTKELPVGFGGRRRKVSLECVAGLVE